MASSRVDQSRARKRHANKGCIMLNEAIKKKVSEHYRMNADELLLLSELGNKLRVENQWPILGENRSLLTIAKEIDGVHVILDENMPTFVAIIPSEKEHDKEKIMTIWHSRCFLRGLPKALLDSFTKNLDQNQDIFFNAEPNPGYRAGGEVNGNEIIVDQDLRMPGIDAANISKISSQNVKKLEANIREWSERHHVILDELKLNYQDPKFSLSDRIGNTALERLRNAQSNDVAKRFVIPIDIAVLLSRAP